MGTERIILLVEDNPDDEALTIKSLRSAKIKEAIVVAHNGVEALDYLFGKGIYSGRNPHDLPAIVLLDLKLPKIDGLEVLRQIRANPITLFLPVVALTSSNEERDIIESYHHGANSYVRKPVDYDEFTEAVKRLGIYWLLINEAPPKG